METFNESDRKSIMKLVADISKLLPKLDLVQMNQSGLSIIQEKQMRLESAQMGAEIALGKLGLIKDEISQREAYRMFGEAQVRSWVNLGLVSRIKSGERNSKATYSRIELETLKRLHMERRLK